MSVRTKDNCELVLKSKNYYDEDSQTQYMPGIYEFYNEKNELLQAENMDFQIHLYKYGEMEQYLKEVGFTNIKTYSSFLKKKPLMTSVKCFYLNAILFNVWIKLIQVNISLIL